MRLLVSEPCGRRGSMGIVWERLAADQFFELQQRKGFSDPVMDPRPWAFYRLATVSSPSVVIAVAGTLHEILADWRCLIATRGSGSNPAAVASPTLVQRNGTAKMPPQSPQALPSSWGEQPASIDGASMPSFLGESLGLSSFLTLSVLGLAFLVFPTGLVLLLLVLWCFRGIAEAVVFFCGGQDQQQQRLVGMSEDLVQAPTSPSRMSAPSSSPQFSAEIAAPTASSMCPPKSPTTSPAPAQPVTVVPLAEARPEAPTVATPAPAPTAPAGSALAPSLAEVDSLRHLGKADECLKLLEGLNAAHPNNVEVLWRMVRAHVDLTYPLNKANERDMHIKLAVELGQKAVDLDPANAAAHAWNGIGLGKFAQTLGLNERIKTGLKVRNELQEAIRLDESLYNAHYALGQFCWNVAKLSLFQRKAAVMLFGFEPTFDDVEKHSLKCHALNPKYPENLNALGELYKAKGDKSKAREWFQKAADRSLVVHLEGGKQAQEEARKSLEKL